jgi:hypothetical protein
MESLVMKGLPMVAAPLVVLLKMIAPFYAMSEDPLGIGFSVYYDEEIMAPYEKVKLLSGDGLKPDHALIQTRRYPFTKEVYLVVDSDSLSTNIEM